MPVTQNNKETRAKLVFQTTDGAGGTKQFSRTYSNLVQNITDDTLYAGVQAMFPMLANAPTAVMRIDEVTLVQA